MEKGLHDGLFSFKGHGSGLNEFRYTENTPKIFPNQVP